MNIYNVFAIRDNGKYVEIELGNSSIIELPTGDHKITILDMENPGDNYRIDIRVELYAY